MALVYVNIFFFVLFFVVVFWRGEGRKGKGERGSWGGVEEVTHTEKSVREVVGCYPCDGIAPFSIST